MASTLPKAFRQKRPSYGHDYVMYQLLQDPGHWPTAGDASGGGQMLRMLLQASDNGYLAATI
jgi:hypothetical protein